MSISLSSKSLLTWPDYVFIASVLALCVAVSVYFNRKKKQIRRQGGKLEEFLLASRGLSFLPAACSIAATLMTPIALTATTGDLYTFGVQYIGAYFFMCVGIIIVSLVIVPVYRKSQYVSVFQLVEERFDGNIRRLFSFVYVIHKLFQMALILYLPALSLTTLTPFNTLITTFIVGFVCTTYSSLGGFRTVVWTDAIQCVLILNCTVMIIFQWSIQTGGLTDLWKTSMDNGYLTEIYWSEKDAVRSSMWPIFLIGCVASLDHFVINQATMQRVLAVKSNSIARNAVIFAAILVFLFAVMLSTVGAILYTNYGQCNPLYFSEYTGAKKIDQILVYAIGDMFSNYPVLKGVAISGIISASLSTFSSYINAFAALALEDFIKPWFPSVAKRDNVSVKICMTLSFGFGTLVIFTSFLIPIMGNGVKVLSIIGGIFRGPLSGIALLLLFYKKFTKMACLISMGLTMSFITWLTIGNALFVEKSTFTTLKHSTNECEIDYGMSKINVTLKLVPESYGLNRVLLPFYKISYLWYSPIGFCMAFLFGLIFTELPPFFIGSI